MEKFDELLKTVKAQEAMSVAKANEVLNAIKAAEFLKKRKRRKRSVTQLLLFVALFLES